MTSILAARPGSAALRRYVDLLHILVIRNLKVRYRGSVLGIYWSLLNPILLTIVYSAILNSLFVGYYRGSGHVYVLAVFCGVVAFNFFSNATTSALPSVVSNGILLNKLALPTSIFPMAQVASAIFQLTVGALPLLLLMALILTHNLWNAIFLLVPISGLVLFSIGVSFLLSMAYVYYRDIPYLYDLALLVMWITSPIFYPLDAMQPQLQRILWFNPMTSVIESVRQIIFSGHLPNLHLAGAALLSGAAVCAVGLTIFYQYCGDFMDLL